MPKGPSQGKLLAIQALRAVAALLVVLFHAQQAVAKRFTEPAFENESYLFAFGAVGVHIFFVISGFIMVYTTASGEQFLFSKFFRRRLQRIYPIYWICVAIYISFIWLLALPSSLTFPKLIGALLLLPQHAAAIIGPAWTLSFEMFFYVTFGIAMKFGLTRGIILLGWSFFSLILIGAAFSFENAVWKLATNTLLLEFLAGSAIGWCLVKGLLPKRGGTFFVATAITLFVAGIIWGYDRLPSVIMWGIPSALLVAGFLMLEERQAAGAALRRLAYFGDSSYALYLIHILVIMLFVSLAETLTMLTQIEPAIAALPIAVASLIMAEVLHHWVERPLLRRLSLT